MKAVKTLGKAVPEDISILCFDSPYNYVQEYVFTFIRQNEAEMGSTAIELLLKQMREKGVSDKVYLDADLVVGTTTMKK
jgi:DNA-binding LacI/PurR family transcriptional regulator